MSEEKAAVVTIGLGNAGKSTFLHSLAETRGDGQWSLQRTPAAQRWFLDQGASYDQSNGVLPATRRSWVIPFHACRKGSDEARPLAFADVRGESVRLVVEEDPKGLDPESRGQRDEIERLVRGAEGILVVLDTEKLLAGRREGDRQVHLAAAVARLLQESEGRRRSRRPVAYVFTKVDLAHQPVMGEAARARCARLIKDPTAGGRELLARVMPEIERSLSTFAMFAVSSYGRAQRSDLEGWSPAGPIEPFRTGQPLDWLMDSLVRARRLGTARRVARTVLASLGAALLLHAGGDYVAFARVRSSSAGAGTLRERDAALASYAHVPFGRHARAVAALRRAAEIQEVERLRAELDALRGRTDQGDSLRGIVEEARQLLRDRPLPPEARTALEAAIDATLVIRGRSGASAFRSAWLARVKERNASLELLGRGEREAVAASFGPLAHPEGRRAWEQVLDRASREATDFLVADVRARWSARTREAAAEWQLIHELTAEVGRASASHPSLDVAALASAVRDARSEVVTALAQRASREPTRAAHVLAFAGVAAGDPEAAEAIGAALEAGLASRRAGSWVEARAFAAAVEDLLARWSELARARGGQLRTVVADGLATARADLRNRAQAALAGAPLASGNPGGVLDAARRFESTLAPILSELRQAIAAGSLGPDEERLAADLQARLDEPEGLAWAAIENADRAAEGRVASAGVARELAAFLGAFPRSSRRPEAERWLTEYAALEVQLDPQSTIALPKRGWTPVGLSLAGLPSRGLRAAFAGASGGRIGFYVLDGDEELGQLENAAGVSCVAVRGHTMHVAVLGVATSLAATREVNAALRTFERSPKLALGFKNVSLRALEPGTYALVVRCSSGRTVRSPATRANGTSLSFDAWAPRVAVEPGEQLRLTLVHSVPAEDERVLGEWTLAPTGCGTRPFQLESDAVRLTVTLGAP